MHIVAELEYSQNNGTLAIRPAGLLRKLKLTTHSGEDRVWVFLDAHEYEDDDQDHRVNHLARGIRVGTYEEGRAFLARCRELKLRVECLHFYVPFSNGLQRHANTAKGPIGDWLEQDLKLMRWDLPTPEQLQATRQAAINEIRSR